MIEKSLNGSWRMTGADKKEYTAQVPGSVLRTLLEHKVIPDPFDGINEPLGTAATEAEYAFERTFEVSAEELSREHCDLVFEGLDTLARVELNGKCIAETDNMHRTWRFPVKQLLLQGENKLRVTFAPALDYVRKAAKEDPEVTYIGGSGIYGTGAIRKAHYMFGWDWGPSLPDAGIWRDVTLEAYSVRLENIMTRQIHKNGEVTLKITADTGAEEIRAAVRDPDGGRIACITVKNGETVTVPVPKPRLWWPNGLGEQPLYSITVTALSDDKKEDQRSFCIGLRTMTVSREKDQWGEEFAFCCNGVKFFAMGADYIPEDNLLTRMSREKTERLLEDCREAHFNCVRVWGGGVYPSDDFYDLCDEKGLVVWQDMMFACNTYRLTDAFRTSVSAEAADNLRRIRHHASLGMICGNNEMETAWNEWEDVKNQSEALREDYLELFERVLREISEREAPDTFYWPSSPSSGGYFDEPNSLDRGDVHDWSVWHGRRPFSDFTERYPRFCSEFGFESFPCMDTLRSFVHSEREMNPFSKVMESHQKCNSGNSTMLYYLAQTLSYPFSMEQLVHSSQFLQGEAMKAGVEHWRRNRGHCMGAVYWQLNDCWPVASWAGIDCFGRWKALHYMAKRFFAPVLVSLKKDENGWLCVISNEKRSVFKGTAVCRLRDSEGRILREVRAGAELRAMSAAPVLLICPREEEKDAFAECVLLDEQGNTVSENLDLPVEPKHFPLQDPEICAETEGNSIRLTAKHFAMGVALEAGEARFSDNWFALYPGETRTVTADREIGENELKINWLK